MVQCYYFYSLPAKQNKKHKVHIHIQICFSIRLQSNITPCVDCIVHNSCPSFPCCNLNIWFDHYNIIYTITVFQIKKLVCGKKIAELLFICTWNKAMYAIQTLSNVIPESGFFHTVLLPSSSPCSIQTVRLGIISCVYLSPNSLSQHFFL